MAHAGPWGTLRLLVDGKALEIALERLSIGRVSIRARERLSGGGVIGREALFVAREGSELVRSRSRMGSSVDLVSVYSEYLRKDAEVVSVG